MKNFLILILTLLTLFCCVSCKDSSSIICPNCGYANSEGVKYCSDCGESMSTSNDNNQNSGENNNNGNDNNQNSGENNNNGNDNNQNSGENNNNGNDNADSKVPPQKPYIEQCINKVPGITEYEFVTEETDPMNNLNKPGWYIEYVYFSYVLVNQSNVLGETLLDKGTDAGGSIEIYKTKEDAIQRDDYLKSFDGTIFSAGSHIVYDFCVVRTSDELTATQQKFLENNIIFALKGETNRIKNLNSAPTESETIGYSQGLEFKINSDNKSYSLIGKGSCKDKNIRIPKSYNNLPITQIAKNCFRNDSDIISVEIPSSVTVIMYYSFENCSNLKSVQILNGTKTISYNVFENCVSLEQISIPQSVDYIGSSAFYNCPSLYMVNCDSLSNWCKIYFGNCYANPTYYSKNLYLNYSLITKLTIPNEITEIKSYAFCNCLSISDVNIPNSVNEIYEDAFYGCNPLKSKVNGITYIDNWAIYCDRDTTSAILKEDTVGIAWRAFYDCNITNINIPNSVKNINAAAFSFSSLKNITLPNNITTISGSTFYGCSSLQEISIPNGVKTIGYASFYGCSALETVNLPQYLVEISDEAFRDCKKLTNISIPDSVTKIGGSAFSSCYALKSIRIPSNIVEIGCHAFSQCNLEFNVLDNIKYLGNENNPYILLFDVSDTNLSCYNISSKTKIIYSYAFYNCKNIANLTIPDTVVQIGDDAFRDCSSLKNIDMGDNVLCLGNSAFSGCNSLTNLHLSNKLQVIGANAFSPDSIKTIIIYNNVNFIGNNAFNNQNDLIVYYKGTQSEWDSITKNQSIDLNTACLYFYSNVKPNSTGNFWHYVENVPTIWS